MFNPIYKIRRPIAGDRHWVIFKPTAHLWVIGAFGWRILVSRYGPPWWQTLNRFEVWKYRLPKWMRAIWQ